MEPQVDHELCIGCGLCADLAPDVFELNDDGLSDVIGEVTEENEAAVQEAEEGCPTCAIAV